MMFRVESRKSGLVLGVYEAADEAAALDAAARAAGYSDFADACERSGDGGEHLRVIAVASADGADL